MKSYTAAFCTFFFSGGAAASALMACASQSDIPPAMGFGGSSTGGTNPSSSGSGSSGSEMDATTQPTGSSSGYGDDSTSPTSSTSSSGVTSDDGGDDGGDDSSGGTASGPTCTSTQGCVDAIPSGWSGFVQLLIGGTPDAGSTCAGPYNQPQPTISGQTNPDGGAATCGSCDCFVPDSGVVCSVGLGINNLLCLPMTGGPTTNAAQGECVMQPSLPSGEVTPPTLTSGTCQGGAVAVTSPPPPATWETATACAAAGDGGTVLADAGAPAGPACMQGQACAPLPAGEDAGTPSGVCIYQEGVQTCPPAGTTVFTNTFVVGAVEDSRGCGCTCGTLTCPADGYVEGYSNANCSGAPSITIDAGTPCKGSLNQMSFEYFPSKSGSPGTCGPATAGPTGTVDIDGGTATTFCCIP